MALNEGQLVTYALDEIIETVQNLTPMASKVTKYTPPAESMQRSSNTVWMPVEQEAPTQTGWDLTGNATGILELSVKCNMGELTYELEVLTQFCLLVEVHIVEDFCNLRGVELVLGFNLGGFNLNLRLLVLCLEQFSLTLQKDTLRLNLLC